MDAGDDDTGAGRHLIGEKDVLAAITCEYLDETVARKDTAAAMVSLGKVRMTTFRFQFMPDEHEYARVRTHLLQRSDDEIASFFSVPLGCIASVKKKNSVVEILTKDLRQMSFRFDVVEVTRIFNVLTTLSPSFHDDAELIPCNQDWNVYDETSEWERQGVFENGKWRISHFNKDFKEIETYPELIVVPTSISDVVLRDATAFRSIGRIPSLSWLNKANGATLTRSSQPKLSIASVSSMKRFRTLCQSTTCDNLQWLGNVEDTKWLVYVRQLLKSSLHVVTLLRQGESVLLHCSHGWDRTSQISALAQLILDPYYRTWEGFQVLIEKEWLALGHPFQLRLSHGEKADTQESPIFIQFLDYALHSCRFGTFLLDCKKLRKEADLENRTPSVWTWLNGLKSELTEQSFAPNQTLDPPVTGLLKRVVVWESIFLRWSAQPLLQEPPVTTNFFSGNAQRISTWQLPQGTINALNTALMSNFKEAQVIRQLRDRIAELEAQVAT
ncbi:Myotubularin-like protein, partial [Globisporangium splendens]